VHFLGGYLGQMCIFLVDILGKCAIRPQGISWANMQYDEGYLGKYLDKLVYMITCLKLIKKDGVVMLVDIYNSDKMGIP
jgi:hypothetical protein